MCVSLSFAVPYGAIWGEKGWREKDFTNYPVGSWVDPLIRSVSVSQTDAPAS